MSWLEEQHPGRGVATCNGNQSETIHDKGGGLRVPHRQGRFGSQRYGNAAQAQ